MTRVNNNLDYVGGSFTIERLSIEFTANGKELAATFFNLSLTLLRTYLIYLVNRQESSLIESSLSVFWQKLRKFHLAVCRKRHAKQLL